MVASPPGLQSREGRPNSSYPNNSRAVNVFFEMDNYSRSGGCATGTPGVRPAYPGPDGDISSAPLPTSGVSTPLTALVLLGAGAPSSNRHPRPRERLYHGTAEDVSAVVTLTTSDGFIVGVDSAVTVSFGPGKTNIYEDTEKIFQLGEKRIGIATFGLAGIGDRSIGSFVREFESVNFEGAMDDGKQVAQISEALRAFFYQEYERVIIPAVEAYCSMPFQQIPINDRPYLGLLVGGYSDESKTREQIFVDSDRPSHGRVRSARAKMRRALDCGPFWNAS